MLHLCYANQMEALIEPLLKHIQHSQYQDPFEPIHIIIPNPSVSHFIRFQVAQRFGVCANLKFHYLRRFLAENIQAANESIKLLESESLQLLIFRQLNNPEVLQHIQLEPVRTYLDIAETKEEREGRCIQLAGQLARLFEEYAYTRQKMLQTWQKKEKLLKNSSWSRAEQWQSILWRSLFDEEGAMMLQSKSSQEESSEYSTPRSQVPSKSNKKKKKKQPALFHEDLQQKRSHKKRKGNRWMFLPEAVQATYHDMELPEQVHVFGLSYVAIAFAHIFATLSERSDLHIYALNPCCEFWEDVDHRLNIAREGWKSRVDRVPDFQDQEDAFNLEDPHDTPALRLWGRPGREYIRTLNQLSLCDFDTLFIDPADQSEGSLNFLHELQRDILYRAPNRSPLNQNKKEDDSIRLIACPGLRREVEIVADEIWRLVQESEKNQTPLRFHQIAVMVTDHKRQEYLTHIDAIFRERYQIPFNMIDRHMSAQSRVIEGVKRLLELPLGDFDYLEVLHVATHPVIGGALESVHVDRWRQWGEQLNIKFGLDQEDLHHTYIDRDVYHWDQGLKRLLLGLFMQGEAQGDHRIFEVEERAWVPFDIGHDAFHDAGHMVHLCRRLLLDASHAKKQRMSLSYWCMYFTRLFNHYIICKSQADEQALTRCLQCLEELKDTDLEQYKISYDVAQTLVKNRLKQLESKRGQHQADGVVVSSLLPMRAIPFHTIFLLGMGERDFPAKTAQNPLDLRQAKQLAGDVNPSQRDRYLFLEILLSARQRLIMSYIAFDDRTGDPLEPSAVVRELHFISRGYLGTAGLQAEPHALSAYDLSYDWDIPTAQTESEANFFKQNSPPSFTTPEVLKGIRAARLRHHLNDFLGVKLIQRDELSSAIKIWDKTILNEYLGMEKPPQIERVEGHKIRLSLSQIRAFLYSPLQGSARAMLQMMQDEVKDEEAPLHDPLFMRYQEHYRILTQAFWQGKGVRADVWKAYEHLFERASLKGEAPVGIFAQEQKRKDQNHLSAWIQNLQQFQIHSLDTWQNISIGEGKEFEDNHMRLASIPLRILSPQGKELDVELTAQLSPLQSDYAATLQCVTQEGVGEHLFLRGFLEMVFLAAAHQPLKRNFRVYLNPYGEHQLSKLYRNYHTPTPIQAKQWLTQVCSSMLSGFHAYRLPIKSVLKWRTALERDPSAHFKINPKDYSAGPIKRVDRFPIPPSQVALDMVTQRFTAWFKSEVHL